MKKYDLWFYCREDQEWGILKCNVKLDVTLKCLYFQTFHSIKSKSKGTLFKISENSDKSWMKHIPKYLLEKRV